MFVEADVGKPLAAGGPTKSDGGVTENCVVDRASCGYANAIAGVRLTPNPMSTMRFNMRAGYAQLTARAAR
jgi:hypothetical protein